MPGTHAFRVAGYGTTDPLEEVPAADYVAPARGLLRPGELIYVSICPREGRSHGTGAHEPRMALVMIQADARTTGAAGASGRLAPRADHQGRPGAARTQDFGRPSAGAHRRDIAAPTASDPSRRRPRSSAAAAARPAAATKSRHQEMAASNS